MHVGVANQRWWGKRSRHSRCMRNPQFYVTGNRPMVWPLHCIEFRFLWQTHNEPLQPWVTFDHAPLNSDPFPIFCRFVNQFPFFVRQNTDWIDHRFGGWAYKRPPQSRLTFCQAPAFSHISLVFYYMIEPTPGDFHQVVPCFTKDVH